MKAAVLNFAKIIESNPKIYVSIIIGFVACLLLLIVEAVHVQMFAESLATKDQSILKAAIQPLTQRYSLSRYFIIVIALIWSVYSYKKTQKKLGL